MMRRKVYKTKSTKEYTCLTCGLKYKGVEKQFFTSSSILYSYNDGHITTCKNCINRIYKKYLEQYKDEYQAIKRVCMLFDLYFSQTIFEMSERFDKTKSTRMAAYISKLSLKQYCKKTYDDFLLEHKDDDNKQINNEIPERFIKTWGFGFTLEEYQLLNNKFSEWKSKVEIDGVARETLVRDLCVIKLQQHKALQEENIDIYNKLQKTYQDTLASANLKPIQIENDDKMMEKPLGVMIEMFENEEPIPEPLPEWKDVDKIVRLFTIYFLGHLCKMLNIRNRYSEMYEQEMQKYRVSLEEIEDLSDEDIFEYLSENGFKERTDEEKDEKN